MTGRQCTGCGDSLRKKQSDAVRLCRTCFLLDGHVRRCLTAGMYLDGWLMREMAEALGTSLGSISTTLAELRNPPWNLPHRKVNGRHSNTHKCRCGRIVRVGETQCADGKGCNVARTYAPFFNAILGRWMITINGRQEYRYRVLMEQHLGRRLEPSEHVHHINGDSSDDRIENLAVMPARAHAQHHHPKLDAWARDYDQCIRCGSSDSKHWGRGVCHRCKAREHRYQGTCDECGSLHTSSRPKRFCSNACASRATARGQWAPGGVLDRKWRSAA